MDEKNEVEALNRVAECAALGVSKWDEDVRAEVKANGWLPYLHYAARAIRDAVLASLAARGGTLSAAELGKARWVAGTEMDAGRLTETLSAVLDHAAAQGATIAALEAKHKALAEQYEADRYAIHAVLMWAGEWGPRAPKPSRHVMALVERVAALEQQRDEALVTIAALQQRAEQAERERKRLKASTVDAQRYAIEAVNERIAAESALATLRQAVEKHAGALPPSPEWFCAEQRTALLDAGRATPAPEHPDTVALHGVLERLDAWYDGRAPAEVLRSDKAVWRYIRGDSGPSGGGEPTREEMESALGAKPETFAYGGTIRRCIDCRVPVFGGPTRCLPCATGPSGGGETCGVCIGPGKLCAQHEAEEDADPSAPTFEPDASAPGLAACVPVKATPTEAEDWETLEGSVRLHQHDDVGQVTEALAALARLKQACHPKSDEHNHCEHFWDASAPCCQCGDDPEDETCSQSCDVEAVEEALRDLYGYGHRNESANGTVVQDRAQAALARLKQARQRAAEAMREMCAKVLDVEADSLRLGNEKFVRDLASRIRALPLKPG